MNQVERLLNLITLLLGSANPVTFQQLRDLQPEAYGQADVESAKRMFERDKDILREGEIPIRTVKNGAGEDAYTIPEDEYYLPKIDFTPEELSALFVAARAAGPDPLAEDAMRKLSFRSEPGPLASTASPILSGGPDLLGPRVLAAAEAISAGRRIRFAYRTNTGDESHRTVDPYAFLFRSGNWYVVGVDVDRGEPRSFRLSRFSSDVSVVGQAEPRPDGFDAVEVFSSGGSGRIPSDAARATVLFDPGVAWWAASEVAGSESGGVESDGRVRVEVPAPDVETFVSWVLSFGADAEVIEPAGLRSAVVRRVEEALASL